MVRSHNHLVAQIEDEKFNARLPTWGAMVLLMPLNMIHGDVWIGVGLACAGAFHMLCKYELSRYEAKLGMLPIKTNYGGRVKLLEPTLDQAITLLGEGLVELNDAGIKAASIKLVAAANADTN